MADLVLFSQILRYLSPRFLLCTFKKNESTCSLCKYWEYNVFVELTKLFSGYVRYYMDMGGCFSYHKSTVVYLMFFLCIPNLSLSFDLTVWVKKRSYESFWLSDLNDPANPIWVIFKGRNYKHLCEHFCAHFIKYQQEVSGKLCLLKQNLFKLNLSLRL